MHKLFIENTEIYDEKRLQNETDFNRFEWRKINGIWINIVREYEQKNGIFILRKDADENKD